VSLPLLATLPSEPAVLPTPDRPAWARLIPLRDVTVLLLRSVQFAYLHHADCADRDEAICVPFSLHLFDGPFFEAYDRETWHVHINAMRVAARQFNIGHLRRPRRGVSARSKHASVCRYYRPLHASVTTRVWRRHLGRCLRRPGTPSAPVSTDLSRALSNSQLMYFGIEADGTSAYGTTEAISRAVNSHAEPPGLSR
jgi:hypothetical protein